MKYTYAVESFFLDRWRRLFDETFSYCLGYLKHASYSAPRNAYRITRSDGRVMSEVPAATDCEIGQVAGWPTAEQYEAAAQRALAQAARIRREAKP